MESKHSTKCDVLAMNAWIEPVKTINGSEKILDKYFDGLSCMHPKNAAPDKIDRLESVVEKLITIQTGEEDNGGNKKLSGLEWNDLTKIIPIIAAALILGFAGYNWVDELIESKVQKDSPFLQAKPTLEAINSRQDSDIAELRLDIKELSNQINDNQKQILENQQIIKSRLGIKE